MYRRFLTDTDYLSIMSKEAFHQLVREVDSRILQAEEVSEASIVEYLHGKFEVEKALEIGKVIAPYNPQITYPAGSYFLIDDKPVRALRTISGNKRPSLTVYWKEYERPVGVMTEEEEQEAMIEAENKVQQVSLEDSFKPDFMVRSHHHHGPRPAFVSTRPDHACDLPAELCKARKYSQRHNYQTGDIVMFSNKAYECLYNNGPAYNDIQIPGIVGWKQIEVAEWETLMDYEVNTVVSYKGGFYALLSKEEYDPIQSPIAAPDEVWGMIADYDENETYEFSETEWVVKDGAVFVPSLDPNASELKQAYNYDFHDPRNINLRKHMLRMAVYELHKIIAPHNVSTARITDYEASLQWLQDVSKMRIDPGIPRCIDKCTKKEVTDYGLATYRRDYNPYENEWQI